MFYIVHVSYVGPNQDQHWDEDEIQIRTKPAFTNMSKEDRVEGWCGTTNDWRVDAHGAYETPEAAEAAIREKFGPVRENDYNGESFLEQRGPSDPDDPDDPGIVAVFKAGEMHPAHPDVADQWAYEWREEVKPTSTAADLEAMFQDMEKQAKAENMTFEDTKDLIMSLLEGYRDGDDD